MYNVAIVSHASLLTGDLSQSVKEDTVADIAPLNQIKVLAYQDKGDWILEQKYNIGKKTKPQEEVNK
jgi:hypothetical protein